VVCFEAGTSLMLLKWGGDSGYYHIMIYISLIRFRNVLHNSISVHVMWL
jgi:hypothetical protein